jgi:hypothetical protein
MNTLRLIFAGTLLACAATISGCSGKGNGGGNCGGYGGCEPANLGAGAPAVSGVTITGTGVSSVPAAGGIAIVSGTAGAVTITPTVSAPNGIASVDILLDNLLLTTPSLTGAGPSFPFALWNTTTATDGGHTITARVTDTRGLVGLRTIPVFIANTVTHNVSMTAFEEVPLIPSPATATAATGTGTVTVNQTTGAVSGTLTFANFRDTTATTGNFVDPTAAHIHEAFAGAAGPVIVNIAKASTSYFCGGTTLCTAVTGTNPQVAGAADPTFAPTATVTGRSSSWSIAAGTVLTGPQMTSYRAGRLYLNVHSGRFPAGELRTQIKPANIQVAMAALSGAQEVPANASTATGVVAVTTDSTLNTMTVHVNSDLAGVVGAHLHTGAAGVNGPVFINLVQDGALATHYLSTPESITVTPGDIADFNNDLTYANLHTAAFPGGEIRGQVLTSRLVAAMSNANEVPPVQQSYTGAVALTFNPYANEACVYGANPIPITDTITMSHIHTGAAGTNGPVVVNFGINLVNTCATSTAAILGVRASGTGVLGNPGNHYYNIHTTSYPGGALRGQLSRP